MEQLLSSIPAIIFFVVGAIAIASSILVVAMRNPVHSALFLLLTFLCVAIVFFLMGAEFVGAVQVLVYAGGVMVLFLFAVMLINVRHLDEEAMLSPYWKGGVAVGLGLFILFATLVRSGSYHTPIDQPQALTTATQQEGTTVGGNSEAIGMALYQDYLVPFEVASLFLLVAMIGAIVIGKRDLLAEEEEALPEYIAKRVEEEKRVKEAMGA